MLVLRLAFRNLLRHKRRNLLSAMVVLVGVGVLIIGDAFLGGMRENIVRAQEDTVSSHVLVRPKDYPSGMVHPVDHLLVLDDAQRAWLDENAVAWTGRLWFSGRAVRKGDSMRVRIIAFDPQTDEAVFPRTSWKVASTIPTQASDGVLVSTGVARLLQIEAGSMLIVEARTVAGAINALEIPVAGVFSAGNPMLDQVSLLVTDDLARELVRNDGAVSHIALRLDSREQADAFAAQAREVMGPEAEVVTWYDESKDFLAIQDVRQRALNLVSGVLLLLASLGIMNTTLMAAFERVREVGTLRAMGMTRPSVLVLFVIEGALVGVVGGLLGVAWGGGMASYYATNGIDLSAAATGANLPISTMLYTVFDPGSITQSFLVGVVLAALAATWPAWVASRMEPAEAVRAT